MRIVTKTKFTRLVYCLPLLLGVALVGVTRLPAADSPRTAPPAGLREHANDIHALVGARIVTAPGEVIEQGVLVIRDGVIVALGAEAAAPPDATVHNLAGKTLYAGLIDAYGEVDLGNGEAGGAAYWNEKVTPERGVSDAYTANAELNKKLRGQGVAVRLVAPSGGIVKGASAVVTTADAEPSESILRPRAALHARLTPAGRSRNEYPNSPMGAMTLVRQAFYDADWYAKAWRAYERQPGLARPERNEALAALAPFLAGELPVVIDAGDELYALRADQVGKEFKLNVILRGSGKEYRRVDAVVATGRPVIAPLNFPKPPDVATPEKAASISLERMLDWDLAPENPARLSAAGVPLAFTSHGLRNQGEFLAQVRKAVEHGLAPDRALEALTVAPAGWFGLEDKLGTLAVGKAAHVLVADGDLFDKKTKLLAIWIDGRRHELESPPAVDPRGAWEVTIEAAGESQSNTFTVTLSGDAAKPSGKLVLAKAEQNEAEQKEGEAKEAEKKETEHKLERVALDGQRFSCTFAGKPFGRPGVARLSATISTKDAEKPTWLGYVVWADGAKSACMAERVEAADAKADEEEKVNAEQDDDQSNDGDGGQGEANKNKARSALYDLNFPLGAFGRTTAPEQPAAVVFRNATVWTSGPQGNLEGASVLVENGKIAAVGHDVKAPAGAVEVDASGRHITPGLIDCHSHIATDGGVNESGQTITAEVRIGDFIDPNDIAIYRQLAGGTTSANILHGSANTIGGQNQVIKFRWGGLPEELKVADAPPGIKFALGENVKQSNWGSNANTRYPQTRMGVPELVRDAFEAARAYRKSWQAWRTAEQGLPPRVDLELEALAEVVEGKRLVHCHSYRQDEILALMRVCEDFGVRIATFQHILEGYKVADVMVRHGVGGSSFSDWWAYKFEVYDAIPYNGALLRDVGVVVSFNSDDAELGRRMNLEAAKAVKYGGVPPAEALKFVTLNPAKQLGIDHRTGSLEPGKDADLVLWSGSPLSTRSLCLESWIDGCKYFDREEDLEQREKVDRMRAALIERILGGDEKPAEADEVDDENQKWARTDLFCRQRSLDEFQEEHDR